MDSPLLGDKINCWSKHWVTILVLSLIVVAIIVTIVLVVVLPKDDSEENNDEKKIPLPVEILKNDSDFIKPQIKLSAEFKLVHTKNGMTGLLINDPYTTYSHVNLNIPNGSYTETVPGLAQFGEHMVSGGSENYPNLVPVYNPVIGGVYRSVDNAYTSGELQGYYMTVPYNFLFEESIDLLIDWFRYPFYNAEVVKKEIQAVNSEFYLRANAKVTREQAIMQQLSSTKTSFNGMACGNNETLDPNDSENLAKKLRGYHMEIKKPENIFFTLYSNETMETLENYTEKYFTYKMHEYKKDEIDEEDRKKLIENGKNIIKFDIFDENLYQHAFYFNSESKINILDIFFQFGKIDYAALQFEVIHYLRYLFNSESLNNILIEKNYMSERISLNLDVQIENNNVVKLTVYLTEEGVKKISDVLLIIFKYIEIIKKQGYEKKYFENFIKYKRNKQLLDFSKKNFEDIDKQFLNKIIRNYRLYGVDQIFTDGTPSEKDYNEDKLKELLNKFQYEKSFFGLNTINKSQEFLNNTFLESPSMKTLKYFNCEYLYGKIPEELKEKINNKTFDIENLYIRDINNLFSEQNETVIPCYKQTPNNCQELKEFDFEKDDNYSGVVLEEENQNYKTVYQIDKSSESHLVGAYLQFYLSDEEYNFFIFYYLANVKLYELNEAGKFDMLLVKNQILTFTIKCFNDNIESIFEKFIEILKEIPNDNEINYLKNQLILFLTKNEQTTLDEYTTNLYEEFMNGQKKVSNLEEMIESVEIILKDFKNIYKEIFLSAFKSITLTMAGNIDKTLVESIHNKTRDNFPIPVENKFILNQPELKIDENDAYIINYYEKSPKLDVPDNSILVKYKFPSKYYDLMIALSSCMEMVAVPLLRFNFSNAYTPKIFVKDGFLNIQERGKYKEIDGMEDDINKIIYEMIKGNLTCPNYVNIVKSLVMEEKKKVDKTPENLFEIFLKDLYPENFENLRDEQLLPIPGTFEELIQEVSSIFINPKRFTFLVVRPDISDKDLESLIEKRKENYKYELNESINIVHTDNITYWINNQ